ncbi:tetratricopeptide repeat protein [Verrucosispora sp. WMMC514]|uniref:tetratricopeptide repeat protein n=1 Tax=Verrucosispora sp. WMMC514 TaxID=3015156 RepID=UPI00248C24A2|nr:tetratricopeptide repeat protein [Verrucosispora sp. WMMC514]WBB91405.1 tetratricopeptide repeat protein [Verrucosispora sp. WMMC514]
MVERGLLVTAGRAPDLVGRFVGIGIGSYDQGRHRDLPRAVGDVDELRHLLVDSFTCEVVSDPDEGTARRLLQALEGAVSDGDPLVLLWSGHGLAASNGLRLLARDSGRSPAAGIAMTDVAGYCAVSGANQLLFILDTCFSGEALNAATVAVEVLQQVPPEGQHVWVGVLTSCQAAETAQDGLLGKRLRELLHVGPELPALQLRWSVHNEFIRGDDLCDAVVKEWNSDRQTPQFQGRGSAWWMFRNPRYDPGAPEQVVEHLLLAARGGQRVDERSWFTGRTVEVNQVVAWVRAGQPGVYVVTGSAGTGKSAIVGRVVSLSNPQERERLLSDGHQWSHHDPGESSVHAHVHARGLTADLTAHLIAGQLVRQGVLVAQEERRNAAELVGHLQRAVEAGTPPPVVVVDGVDEARGEAFPLAEELLLRLSPYAVVVVSTRDLPRIGDGPRLVATLAPDGPGLDLDTADAQQRTRDDLRDYIHARLSGINPRMDPILVAEHVAGTSAGPPAVGSRPFLLARLVTDQLRARPVDTSEDGWREKVAGSTEEAFHNDIAGIDTPQHWQPQHDQTALARTLLSALTRGYGAGLPEEEWLTIANAGNRPPAGFDRDDLTWLLHQLGRYIVQDGEAGVAVYRLAHQSLADHLRPPYRATHQTTFDPQALPVAVALTGRYRSLLDAGVPAQTPGYLWRYQWRHAADAGPAGLDLLRDLAEVDPALTPDVAMAALTVADQLRRWGHRHDAVAPTEEAVTLYRELSAANPAFLLNLAGALNNLGVHYSEVGRRADAVAPTEEAVKLRREQAAANPAFLPDLATALNNLGNCYSEVGRRADAVAPTEEAVKLRRELSAANPAFLPNLAGALNNLGIRYSGVGRRADAVAPTEEAVKLRREQAAANPAFLPDLATALNNLGVRYSGVGRHADAVAPTEEAVTLYRELSAANPAFLPDLATALNNLGVRYSGVGRHADAVAPTEEAVTLYRELSAANPAFLPNLAGTLNNLGNRYSEVGRHADAVAPTEKAVTLYHELSAANPAFLPDLATALNNLGNRYSEVGRHADAVAPTEKAVTLYHELSAANPAFLPDLATALNNLGNRYSGVGRHADAVAPTEKAVTLYHELSAANPAFLPDLAAALNNLGVRYSEVGRRADAVAPTEEAVTLRREQAAANPAFLPDLAAALNNLGNRYSEVGRHADAVAPTEEAVTLYHELSAANPAFLPNLAGALNNLGVRYSEVGRHADAVAPTEEAVTLRREQAAANPAFLPNLAGALNNLGVRYSEVGRHADAVAPTEEAVTLRREQAAANPAFLPNLAGALNNLGNRYMEADAPAAAEAAWQSVLAAVTPPQAAYLLLTRASMAEPPDPAAVGWLTTALTLAGNDRPLIAAVHEQARRHRAADPDRFDTAWTAQNGTLPGWLIVDAGLLATAQAWIDTATYTDERDHLAAHPELLTPAADAAVTDALLPLDQQHAERYSTLRTTARIEGVDAAYRPLLLTVLAHEFADADPAAQAALLADRRDDLLTDTVRTTVAGLAQHDQTGAATRASALLTLAETGDAEPALHALARPDRFPDLLNRLAHQPDSTALAPAAVLASTTASTASDAATAGFYLAVATATAGDLDQALTILTHARRLDPDQTVAWITRLADIGQHHPAVLPLIPPLTEPPADPPGATS